MKYLNALATIPGVGRQTLTLLINKFENYSDIFTASAQQLSQAGLSPNKIALIIEGRTKIDPQLEWQKLNQEEIRIITIKDTAYPALLKEIPDPPALLYYKGNLDCFNLVNIAIIGSRKFTNYGKQVAEFFARDLSKANICVVSGLAIGIDAISHQATLDAQGKTIAVLGSSLDRKSIYPRSNYILSEEIVSNSGLLISEFPIGSPTALGNFPSRNRIMAGISQGILTIEAAEKSGSLITANLALEYNREVFAVPGSIFSTQSAGTNNLIKNGAKLTTSIYDILNELQLEKECQGEVKKIALVLNKDEEIIINCLSAEPTHIDRIIKMTKLETSRCISILAILEIKGAIKNVGGQHYIRL